MQGVEGEQGGGWITQAPQPSQLNLPTPAVYFCHLTQKKCPGSKFWSSQALQIPLGTPVSGPFLASGMAGRRHVKWPRGAFPVPGLQLLTIFSVQLESFSLLGNPGVLLPPLRS